MKTIIVLFLTYYVSCEYSNSGYLTPHVLLQKVTENKSVLINLSCGNHSGEISWRHNGKPMAAQGKDIQTIVNYFDGGNYTCHNKYGDVLNHILVVQQVEGHRQSILDKVENSEHISCSAKNFVGKFQCTWRKSQIRKDAELFHFSVARDSNSGASDGPGNITCTLMADRDTLECEDKDHCAYAEETGRIKLSLFFRSHYRYEVYQHHFYIFEIVRPDPIAIKEKGDRTYTWEYPKTWELEHCYFKLNFQVRVVPPGHTCDIEKHAKTVTTEDTEYTVPAKGRYRKNYKLCVRGQEKASESPWSEWSTHEVKEKSASP